MLNNAESELFTVTEGTLRKSYDKMSSLIKGALENIEILRSKEDGLSGIPSGFTNLDRVTSGWQKSDLIICAARPGMGKTAFALTMARNISIEHSFPIGFFSLEMSSEQLVNRLIASEAELGSSKLRKGDLADHEMVQLHEKIKDLSEAPIFIDDTPGLTIFELRAKARRLVKNHKVKIIIIDYLQLMNAGGNSGNREQEISTISRSLKGIAKELKIPVIALSQVNRGVENRTGIGSKRPMLSDLRESGAIEQDADIVTFIYRPEYYKIYEWDNGDDSRGQAEIIAKHRNGSLKNVRLKFIGEFAKFSDLDYFESENSDAINNTSMISISSSMNNENDNTPFNKSKKISCFLTFFFIPFFSCALYMLIPMDNSQKNHLKAYGIAYYAIENNLKVDWLLNYNGGSFMLKQHKQIQEECDLRNVSYDIIADAKSSQNLKINFKP